MAGAAGSPACALAAPGSAGSSACQGQARIEHAAATAAMAQGDLRPARRAGAARAPRGAGTVVQSTHHRGRDERAPRFPITGQARFGQRVRRRVRCLAHPAGDVAHQYAAMPHALSPPGADGDSDRSPFHPADARAGAARRHAMAGYCAGASCAACTSASAAASCGSASISGSDSASVSHSPPASACSSSSTIASLPSSGATCKVL